MRVSEEGKPGNFVCARGPRARCDSTSRRSRILAIANRRRTIAVRRIIYLDSHSEYLLHTFRSEIFYNYMSSHAICQCCSPAPANRAKHACDIRHDQPYFRRHDCLIYDVGCEDVPASGPPIEEVVSKVKGAEADGAPVTDAVRSAGSRPVAAAAAAAAPTFPTLGSAASAAAAAVALSVIA